MEMFNRDTAVKKLTEMSEGQVLKVLIFMAGMEAEHIIGKQSISDQPRKPPKQTA